MIKRLLPYLKGYQKQAVLAPALVALETICELILPLLMAEIIDNGIANSSLPIILKMGALMLVVASVSMYCGVLLQARLLRRPGPGRQPAPGGV